MKKKEKKISPSRLLEAVSVMLFEAIATHKQILEKVRDRGDSILEDDMAMESVIKELAFVGSSTKKISDFLQQMDPDEKPSSFAISYRIYSQFVHVTSGRPMGLILNGYRERLCMKAILSKLDRLLSKKRMGGLFDWDCKLLSIISSGTLMDADLMFCLYSPIEALQEQIGLKMRHVSKSCHDEWKRKFVEAMLEGPSTETKIYFGFYSVEK